jgi:hypothetical protein
LFKACIFLGTMCTMSHVTAAYQEFRANGGTFASIILR